jgi:uncharacterized protein (DUF427 family)
MKSPGHHQWPEHKVKEKTLGEGIEVEINGQLVAKSHDVIEVDEDGNPARLYFPRYAVAMDKLEPSTTTSQCPFKGTARYFNLKLDGGRTLPDAVWSYEQPYEEHQKLKDRLAFYDDRYHEIHIRAPGGHSG